MKVYRHVAAAVGVMGLASLTIFGATSSAATARKAAASCTASIAVEAPYATGPATQLGLEQLHFAEFAVAADNKALKINVSLGKNDTGLNPALATTRTNAIIASSAVAAIGPAGSQEVEAVGPLYAKAGMAFISGSATNSTLTTSGANSTFFRVVAPDSVQGPQDANYIVKKLQPKAVLIIDDEEAYSTGLVSVMTPILQAAGIQVNHQSYNGNDTGATLQSDMSSLVTSQLNPSETVVILPWQSAANAQLFGTTMQQQGKNATLFGTDGTDSPGQFIIPGTYVSNFGPDISGSKSPLDKAIVKGVAKYGPYGAFGLPTYEATDVVMRAIAAVCKAGKKPSRANVLAAIRKTNIPAAQNPLGLTIAFKADGDLKNGIFYLFHINAKGTYVPISAKA
jgi:branched-chain amino acid transport system substrate-binding protein